MSWTVTYEPKDKCDHILPPVKDYKHYTRISCSDCHEEFYLGRVFFTWQWCEY